MTTDKPRPCPVPPADHLSILARLAAASLGGYGLATALSIALAGMLPEPKADAVLTAALLSFAIYTLAILWAFAARTARLAWLGLLAPTALCGALAWLVT